MTCEPWKPTNMNRQPNKHCVIWLKYIPVPVINKAGFLHLHSAFLIPQQCQWVTLLQSPAVICKQSYEHASFLHLNMAMVCVAREQRSAVRSIREKQGRLGGCVCERYWERVEEILWGLSFPWRFPSQKKKDASISFTANMWTKLYFHKLQISLAQSPFLAFSLFLRWSPLEKIPQPKRTSLQIKNGASHLSGGTLWEISVTSKTKPF